MHFARSAGAMVIAAVAFALAPNKAHAASFTLDSVKNLDNPFGPCHNDPGCGGYFIRWIGNGFDTNSQAQLKINDLSIEMSSERGTFGGLEKVNGDVHQSVPIFLSSGPEASFTIGNQTITNILYMHLQSVGAVDFKGTQLANDSNFLLTIQTTSGAIVFNLCSLDGSSVAFNREGDITGLDFHFCGGLEVTPPPSVPEPTCLFALGALGLGLVRSRRRLALV